MPVRHGDTREHRAHDAEEALVGAAQPQTLHGGLPPRPLGGGAVDRTAQVSRVVLDGARGEDVLEGHVA